MKPFTLLPALLVLSACVPPPRIETAPPSVAIREDATHGRVLAVPRSAVFPKVLDLLLDLGFQVRSANESLGLVAFHQQWVDASQVTRPILSLEGTLLFREEGAGQTRVRLELTGRWEVLGPGKSPGMVSNVLQQADAKEYEKLLDRLEAGLKERGSRGPRGSELAGSSQILR